MTESELTSSTMKRCEGSEDPDASSAGLESLRESERIIAFTDAVVAVAITLLILPLMEFATGDADSGKEFFRRRGSLLGSFITSFWIIALMWNGHGHDKLFSHVGRLTPLVTGVNFMFMICIVWIPVATSLTNFRDRDSYISYAVTMFVTRLLMTVMGTLIRRDPRMWANPSRRPWIFSREKQVRSLVEVSLFFLAGTLCIFGPLRDNSRMAWYALLVLKGPICWALKRLFPALMTGG